MRLEMIEWRPEESLNPTTLPKPRVLLCDPPSLAAKWSSALSRFPVEGERIRRRSTSGCDLFCLLCLFWVVELLTFFREMRGAVTKSKAFKTIVDKSKKNHSPWLSVQKTHHCSSIFKDKVTLKMTAVILFYVWSHALFRLWSYCNITWQI